MAHQPSQGTRVSECEIARTGNYIERVTLTQSPSLPQYVVLEITSQLSTAREPDLRRTRYRCAITSDALAQLQQTLAALVAQETNARGEAA